MITTADAIIDTTARAFGVERTDLLSDRREQHLVWARQAAMLLMRYLLPWMSVQDIGRMLRRDHTTVLSGLAAVRERGREPQNRQYQLLILRIAGELGDERGWAIVSSADGAATKGS